MIVAATLFWILVSICLTMLREKFSLIIKHRTRFLNFTLFPETVHSVPSDRQDFWISSCFQKQSIPHRQTDKIFEFHLVSRSSPFRIVRQTRFLNFILFPEAVHSASSDRQDFWISSCFQKQFIPHRQTDKIFEFHLVSRSSSFRIVRKYSNLSGQCYSSLIYTFLMMT